MSQRTKVMITREGRYYLGMLGFIIAGAVIRDINLLYIMAGMMMGPMLYSIYASTKSLRRLSIQRRFQSLVGLGSPMYVEIAAENPKTSSPAFATVVRDEIRRKGDRRSSAKMSLFFPHISAGGSADASYRARLLRRGEYLLGPMRASTSMPLGLVRATIIDSENESVLVSPQLGELSPAWSRRLDLRKDGSQRSVRRRGKSGGDFYGMGEWRNGDSRSWIHWRTSAKRNKLTVRQFEKRINQNLVVILDLWQPRDVPSPHQAVETAISFAATLLFDYGKHGSTHMVIASVSARSFKLQGTSSPVLRQELMERLAVVQPTSTDTLSEVLIQALPKATSNTKVVLVSPTERDLNDTNTFESVWKRTDIRRSLGDIVKVNTSAPEVADWFRLEPRDARFAESSPVSVDSESLASAEQAVT
jgi:uncharacterized protein (DUF58 family)